jgi:integrase
VPLVGAFHRCGFAAAAVLPDLGVPERTVMDGLRWSSTAMAAWYQRVTDPIRREVPSGVGGLLWSPGEGR